MWPEAGVVWIAFFWQDQSSGRRFCQHARWLRAGFFEREARVDPFASGRLAAIVPSAQGHALVGGGGDAVAPRRRLKSAAEASEHERRGVPDSGRGAEGFGRAAPSERAESAKTFSPGRAASSTPFGPTGNSSVAEAAGSACFNTPRHEFRFQGTTHRHQARTAANHDRLIRSIPLSRPHPAPASKLRFPVSDFGFPRPCSAVGAAGLAEAGLEGWRPEAGGGARCPLQRAGLARRHSRFDPASWGQDAPPSIHSGPGSATPATAIRKRIDVAGLVEAGLEGRRPETGDRRPEVAPLQRAGLAQRHRRFDPASWGKTLHLRSTPDRGQRPRLQRTRTRPIVARRSRAVLVAGLAEAGSEIRAPLSA